MAMKWIPLDGRKEPPFDNPVLIWVQDKWKVATLSEIRQTSDGKVYEFEYGFDHSTTDEATFYLSPEPPKNNQE